MTTARCGRKAQEQEDAEWLQLESRLESALAARIVMLLTTQAMGKAMLDASQNKEPNG